MRLKCWYGIHEPSGESIIPFHGDEYWLKKCKYCRRYIARAGGYEVVVSRKEAMKMRDDLLAEVPYLRERMKGNDVESD